MPSQDGDEPEFDLWNATHARDKWVSMLDLGIPLAGLHKVQQKKKKRQAWGPETSFLAWKEI